MKRIMLMSTVLMAILMLPALASATHITDVVAMGDCSGFNASVDVHFRTTAEYFDLDYTVQVLDADMNEVYMVSGMMTVMQEDMADVTVMIEEMWDTLPDGAYTIIATIDLTSPYPGGMDEESYTYENTVECGSVANEEINFEAVKALYR